MNRDKDRVLPAVAGRKRRARGSGKSGPERPDRRRKRKSCTKAELKRRVRVEISSAVRRIEIFNRITILPEKRAHLEKAVAHLESAHGARAGNHLIRRQLNVCREILRDYERGIPGNRLQQIEIVIDTDY